jgi:hypothetical protein
MKTSNLKAKPQFIFFLLILSSVFTASMIEIGNDFPSYCPTLIIWRIKCPFCGMIRSFLFASKGEFSKAYLMYKPVVLYFPAYIFSAYLFFAHFLKENNIAKLPHKRFVEYLKKHFISVILFFVLFALFFYVKGFLK